GRAGLRDHLQPHRQPDRRSPGGSLEPAQGEVDLAMSPARVLLDKDHATHIARLTLDNPERRNSYDPAMRREMGAALADVASDDGIKVLLLRGAGGVFSTGADMNRAYRWYETPGDDRRPSQRRKLTVDRESFSFYHDYIGYPKATIAQVESFALGGAFE